MIEDAMMCMYIFSFMGLIFLASIVIGDNDQQVVFDDTKIE
jgi:hypothetical protein